MSAFKRFINNVIYQKDEELILSSSKKDMDLYIVQMILGTVYGLLTGGVFLSGYLIYLGASDEIVSYATLMPSICGIFVIFSANYVENKEKRRRFIVVIAAFIKLLLASIVFIPLIFRSKYTIILIYFMLLIGYLLSSVSSLAFNTWFVQVIPQKVRGRYLSARSIIGVIITIVIPVAAGKIVDVIPNQYNGFLILYSVAVVFAILEVLTMRKISDPLFKNIKKKLSLKELFTIPLKNKEFMHYTISLCAFYFLLYISASFSQLYMLKYLKLSFTYINLTAIISYVLQVFVFYNFWGRVSDKLSANFALSTSIWFYICDMLVWFFITPTSVFFMLPMAHVFGSIEGSGFSIGSFTRRYEVCPEEGRVIYDSFFTACLGIALLISPMIGSFLRSFFGTIPLVMKLPYGNFRLVYLLSVLGIACLQLYNYFVYTKKHVPNSNLLKKSSYVEAFGILKRVIFKR